jgi:hypothetical protein
MKVYEVYKEMEYRYNPSSPMSFPSILLVIDEYPKVSKRIEIADWIAEIGSEGRKVDIILVFLSQSGLVKDTKLNTARRENFVEISMTPNLTRQNKAYIRHWNKSKELIELAGIYTPLSNEQKIIKLLDDGLSVGEIAKSVYGSDGGKQREIVKGYLKQ